MTAAILFDSTKCIGCEACVAACKDRHGLPAAVDKRLTASTWTVVAQHDTAFVRRMCMHCESPTCASVCPVGAFQKAPSGAVVYEASRCIGCRYCIMACPFNVPTYQWDRRVPLVRKCTLCADWIAQGRQPACADACPTGATLFGDRRQLIGEARARLAAAPAAYVPRIYGLEDVGGTSVLMVAALPFSRLKVGPMDRRDPLPQLTWNILSKIPDFSLLGGVALYGIFWITNRRVQLQKRTSDDEAGRSET